MRVNKETSPYQEYVGAPKEFSESELRRCRFLLRRLRFLDESVGRSIEREDTTRGVEFAKQERDALAWMLDEIGYLAEQGEESQ